MYKVKIKVKSNNPRDNSLGDISKVGLIPVFFTRIGEFEVYEAFAPMKTLADVKEALVDLAYLLSRKGKTSDDKYAIIYEVKNAEPGIIAGALLGALGGYLVGHTIGAALGGVLGAAVGGIVTGILNEKPLEVVSWPIGVKS